MLSGVPFARKSFTCNFNACIEDSSVAAAYVSCALSANSERRRPAPPSAMYAMAATSTSNAKSNAKPRVIFFPMVRLRNDMVGDSRAWGVEERSGLEHELERERNLDADRGAVLLRRLELPFLDGVDGRLLERDVARFLDFG